MNKPEKICPLTNAPCLKTECARWIDSNPQRFIPYGMCAVVAQVLVPH